jgi:hypothetical protein
MATKQQPLDNIVLSAKDSAKLIGKSVAWLANLVSDGYVKADRKNGRESLYRPAAVAQGYVAFLTDEQRRSSKSVTLSAVQAQRAREIELRIAREQHELIELDEAIGVLDEVVGGLKADFDGLAASVTRDPALRDAIEVKVEEIFGRHADGLQQKANALRASGAVAEADTEDDAGRMGVQEPALRG